MQRNRDFPFQFQESTVISYPMMKIKIFNGRDDEYAVEFIKRFKLLAAFNRWSDKESLKYLPLFLSGNAEKWLESLLRADSDVQFDDACDMMCEKFSPVLTPSMIWKCQMKIGESPREYINRFDRL